MTPRDVWFVGLLALAYLYLDASAPSGRRRGAVQERPLPLPRRKIPSAIPQPPTAAEACPRDLAHTVSLRGDGAKWCLSCDEAFYPVAI